MDALKRSMAWDERAYGREYDLDVFNIVAVSDFNMGAMENKGLNVFNDKYVLASAETATDDDYAGIEGVIAHEYFHNWTGNRITCRDWFQLCLKEGLTVFRDQEFSADQRSAPVKRIADVRALKAAQFPEDAGPLAHNVRPEVYHEINNFYTATVYQKGAEVIRMLKLLIGAETFRAGMDLYFRAATARRRRSRISSRCFAEVSGRDLDTFKRWYSQAGTPLLTVRTHYDEKGRDFRVELAQSLAPTPGQPEKAPMAMPIALGLVDPEGGDLKLTSADASAGELALRRIRARGRAPNDHVHQRAAPPGAVGAARLLGAGARRRRPHGRRSDRAAQARQRQLQSLAGPAEPRDRGCFGARWPPIREGHAPAPSRAFIEAYGSVVADAIAGRIDPAFAALALAAARAKPTSRGKSARTSIPTRSAPRANPCAANWDARTRAGLRRSARLDGRRGAVPPDAAGAGRRALRNGALAMIVAGNEIEGAERAQRQFADADNMTEKLGALAALATIPGAAARARARGLRPQLCGRAADPRQMVRLAGADRGKRDARSRPRADGAPRLLARQPQSRSRVDWRLHIQPDPVQPPRRRRVSICSPQIVLTLDPTNPQIAARLLTALRSWRSLEPVRRANAEATLRRIAATADLSADVRDIVTRSLPDLASPEPCPRSGSK